MSKEYIQEQPESQAEKKTEAQIFEEQDKTEYISESMLGSHKIYAAAEDDITPSIERRSESSTKALGETKSNRIKFKTDPALEAKVAAEREEYEKQQAKKDAEREADIIKSPIRTKPQTKTATQTAHIIEEIPVDDKADIEDQKQLNSNFYLTQTLGGLGAMAWVALLTPLTINSGVYTFVKIVFYLLNIAAIIILATSITKTRDRVVPMTLVWPFIMATLAPGFCVRFFLYECFANPSFGGQLFQIASGVIFWGIGAAIHYYILDRLHIKPPAHLAITYFLMMVIYFFIGPASAVISSHDISLLSLLFKFEWIIKLVCILALDIALCYAVPALCSKLRSKSQW